MSEDILARLQLAIMICNHGAPNGGGPMGPDPTYRECAQCLFLQIAADEISRLRTENLAVKDAYTSLYQRTTNKEEQK